MAAVTNVATTLRAASTVTAMKGTHFMAMASFVRVSINCQTSCNSFACIDKSLLKIHLRIMFYVNRQ